jgi:hypothetical protein
MNAHVSPVKKSLTSPNDKLKERPYSKKHKVATVACINKLIKSLYAIALKGTVYKYPQNKKLTN